MVATAFVLSLGAGEGACDSRPDFVLDAGGALAVEGKTGQGGPSLALAVVWPLELGLRFGVMAFGDDLGRDTGRLTTPAGSDVGPVETRHRAARGGAFRLEAGLPKLGGFDPFLLGTWGLYRVADDRQGAPLHRVDAAGLGLGLGITHRVAARHDAGLALRYHRLSRGAAASWVSANIEWRWRWGATEPRD
jgi:hypothetical protein